MRNTIFNHTLLTSIGLIVLAILATACNAANAPAKPTVKITSLADGSRVQVGQEVEIRFEAADVKGVTQVDVTINGEPVYIEPATPPVNILSGGYMWQPKTPTSHLIQIIAFNVDGAASDTAQVAVTVEGTAAVAASETPPTEPTAETTEETAIAGSPTATGPLVPPTPSGVDGPTPTPTATTGSSQTVTVTATASAANQTKPIVTAKIGLNVRAGPGTNYPVIGRMAENEMAEIIGRVEAVGWWQIVFLSASSKRGWVAANEQFTTATQADNVPVVEAPPLPDNAQPIAPTNPDLPTINSFTAERNAIVAGESVVLSWDLENATAAFLRYNEVEEGVVSPGNKSVSPTADTVYTLVARNEAGESTAQVTISVSGPTPTPVKVLGSGKINVIGGQAIDFDQGLVLNDGSNVVDFYWNAAGKTFERRNSAVGVLLDLPFADITLTHCMTASYGTPITGVDGSKPIIGCYKTSQGRFGKFFVSNWDLTGKLTIDWLTWQ